MSTWMIVGYGGIGSALVSELLLRKQTVIVVTNHISKVIDGVTALEFSDLSQAFKTSLPDIIINTIGMLHDEEHMPEKNLTQLDSNWLLESFKVNLFKTIEITQLLSSYMKRNTSLKMIAFSARVSSISDNYLGGWYSYRISKAALNMFIKTVAIEWSRHYPQASIFGYHPGTVDTPLSKPFQKNLKRGQLFTPSQAANYLLDVLEHLTPEGSGNLYDWQGKIILF